MAYGPMLAALHRRVACFVDRIPTGAKPADLPVERPPTLEPVLIFKVAQAIGLTISRSLLLRADEVIE
jgi:putative ABC transport system substrate-binding protein